ncbi:MAG TPA: hypothetical protein VGZ23_04535 [bacterium]|nr:hypothetical protein [bacterium]
MGVLAALLRAIGVVERIVVVLGWRVEGERQALTGDGQRIPGQPPGGAGGQTDAEMKRVREIYDRLKVRVA